LTWAWFFWSQKIKFQRSERGVDMQTVQVKTRVGIRNIGVVGSRDLPFSWAGRVGSVVDDLIERGFHIASGGALGADQFCLDQVLASGQAAKCVIFSAWKDYTGFPVKVRPFVREAREKGASLFWGLAAAHEQYSVARLALLHRNERLIQACYGLVAFIAPGSRGSIFTISKAVKKHLRLVVFPVGCDLPFFPSVKWVALRCGGVWEGGYKAVYLK
jgi:hypothetical protein